MEQSTYHKPVMTTEVGEYLINNPSGIIIDCTLGGGGHSAYLLERYPSLRVIGIDADEEATGEAARNLERFANRVQIIRENFKNIAAVCSALNIRAVNGILADLGVSSRQLDDIERGFGFLSPRLDMRMDKRLGADAEHIVNTMGETELANLFYTLGGEFFSRPIARAIVRARERRRITSGQELAETVQKVKYRKGKIHPATKVFQALRIAVNTELDNLTNLLNDAPALLASGGRMVILSYHSLEDRIVKNNFRSLAHEGIYRLLTKKVVPPSENEISENPRSRSAKLRAVEKNVSL